MPLENDNVKGPTWNEARSTDPIERMHLATMRRSRFPQPGRPSVGMPSYPGIRLALPRRREIFRRIADIGPDPRRCRHHAEAATWKESARCFIGILVRLPIAAETTSKSAPRLLEPAAWPGE